MENEEEYKVKRETHNIGIQFVVRHLPERCILYCIRWVQLEKQYFPCDNISNKDGTEIWLHFFYPRYLKLIDKYDIWRMDWKIWHFHLLTLFTSLPQIKMISAQHSSNNWKSEIKLPTKPHSMVIFWIKVRRSYRDLSSRADPARENWTWSCTYLN